MKQKMKKNKSFFKISVFISFLVFSFYLYAEPAPCEWTNIYENNKKEIVTPKHKRFDPDTGKQIYESCPEAIGRRKADVEKAKAEATVRQALRDQPQGGGPNNCFFQPPRTGTDKNPEAYRIEVKRLEPDPETGEARFESCPAAQSRAYDELVKTKYNGFESDLDYDIDQFNKSEDERVLAAEEMAKKKAKKEKEASYIALGGALIAGLGGKICSGQCGTGGGGCCAKAPYLYTLAAGLGLAGGIMMMQAGDTEEIAAEYETGRGGGGNEGDETTDGSTATTEGTPGPTPGPTPGTEPPPENDPNSDPLPTDPDPDPESPTTGTPKPDPEKPKVPVTSNKDLEDKLKKHGIIWNPNKKTITAPNGEVYSADDMDSPGMNNFMNSSEGKAFKAKMDALEQQVAQAMGTEDEDLDGLLDGETDSGGIAGLSGGGFAGYGGGGAGGAGGGGRGLRGKGRKLLAGGKKGDNAAKVAGMSVKRGKNRIGVSQDNIFEMIHRRYQTKRKRRQFIELF